MVQVWYLTSYMLIIIGYTMYTS